MIRTDRGGIGVVATAAPAGVERDRPPPVGATHASPLPPCDRGRPLTEAGRIEAFIRREVLPYAPDAWYAPSSVKIGYEISFTRYFYKPQPLRSLDEIRADILAVETATKDLLPAILGERVYD